MRITKIRAEVVHASIYSNYVFVIAETDEGVLGFGDATLDGLEFEVVAAVNNLGGKLVGRDVLEDDCTVSGDGGGLTALEVQVLLRAERAEQGQGPGERGHGRGRVGARGVTPRPYGLLEGLGPGGGFGLCAQQPVQHGADDQAPRGAAGQGDPDVLLGEGVRGVGLHAQA